MMIDIQTVNRAKLGDKEAFSRLYEQLSSSLYKTALFVLGNQSDAEDVVSETFLEAYRGIVGLKDPAACKAWMFKILWARCNRKIAHGYKLKGNIHLDDFPLSDPALSYQQDKDTKLVLLSALADLSYQERTIVVLSVMEGYKIREIAAMLHLPQGTVSSKLHRSLQKLKQTVERSDFSETLHT